MNAAELDAYVKALVDTMPPLSDEQRERVSELLRPAALDDLAATESAA
jgi:hypothetical protein